MSRPPKQFPVIFHIAAEDFQLPSFSLGSNRRLDIKVSRLPPLVFDCLEGEYVSNFPLTKDQLEEINLRLSERISEILNSHVSYSD